MSLLNPVISKFALTVGVPQEVYSCPAGRSHAIVDLVFLKDNLVGDSLVAVGMSTNPNPAALTSVDYFIDDIQLIGVLNYAELNKVIVGSGERLYVQVLSGPNVVVRTSGVEETNPKVIKGGRLAAAVIAGTAQTQIWNNTFPNTAYISASITIFNISTTLDATVEAWISTLATPTDTDKVLRITIPPNDTTILENILLAANERIFVRSSQANTEYFINGVVVSI